MMTMMRLQKFLSAAGFCSRRRGEQYMVDGRVTVNDVVVRELGSKVDSETDRVEVDGSPVVMDQKRVYIALNKPRGYVSTCRRSRPREQIVTDLVEVPERVYPVGRLDKDSTGLLLMTNDGPLHHRLSHPSFDHEKEYDVRVADPIPVGALRKMAAGIPMKEGRTRPADVRKTGARRFTIVLKEGRNRQIRRMVGKVGNRVVSLKRIRISQVSLGDLTEGKWRHLTSDEKKSIEDRRP